MTPFGTTQEGWPRVRIDWRPDASRGPLEGAAQQELGLEGLDIAARDAAGMDEPRRGTAVPVAAPSERLPEGIPHLALAGERSLQLEGPRPIR
jgi:hypothetical protein